MRFGRSDRCVVALERGARVLVPPQPSREADRPSPEPNPEALFLSCLDDIHQLVEVFAAKSGMHPDERDDFQAIVHVKLIEDDYAVLRRYRGRSAMRTYLSAVISNVLHDRRVQKWGKWRSSAAARAAGPVGIRLERLVRRDGVPVETAIRILRSRSDISLSDRALAELAASFPHRSRPHIEADSGALARAPAEEQADEIVLAEERRRRKAEVMEQLQRVLQELDDEDRVILRLRFWEGFNRAEIARALHLEQRPFYRRYNRLRDRLRAMLVASGIAASDVQHLLPGGAE